MNLRYRLVLTREYVNPGTNDTIEQLPPIGAQIETNENEIANLTSFFKNNAKFVILEKLYKAIENEMA